MKAILVFAALVVTGCVHARVRSVPPEAQPADALRLEILRLEEALRARDDTIRALRLELLKLKEIDLKPRTPGGDESNGTGGSGG